MNEPVIWKFSEFAKKFFPALLTAEAMLLINKSNDWHEYVFAGLIALATAFGIDLGTFTSAVMKSKKNDN